MSTISDPSSFTFLLFAQLARRLRQTNARYHHIAYQCRYMRHPTHRAKRLAYRAGLWIDTSKALAACVDDVILSQSAGPDAPIRLLSALSALISSETKAGSEPEGDRTNVAEDVSENTSMPELGLKLRNLPEVVVQRQLDPEAGSLPLFQTPVPGAPLWKPRPLPEEDVLTSEPVWRNATAACPLDLDSLAVVGGGSGSAVPVLISKRKVDNSVGGMVGVADEETWSESQKRRGL